MTTITKNTQSDMNCKSCGTSNPEGAIFCRKCGNKLKEDTNNGCLKTIAWMVAIGVIGCIIVLIYNESKYTSSPSTPSYSSAKTASYLNVSDDDLYFDEDGGSKSISIATDGEWIIGVDAADWVTLSKMSSSISVRVEPNKRGKRTDYFTIVADEITKRVDITQSANTEPYGEIEKIWVDHNKYDDNGRVGMIIHVAFKAHNMLNKEGRVVAYFYYKDGSPLKDTNGRYCTSDGNVAKHEDFHPRYDSSNYSDFELFMPNSELHLDETTSFYFVVNIRYNGRRISDNSEKWNMEYTTD